MTHESDAERSRPIVLREKMAREVNALFNGACPNLWPEHLRSAITLLFGTTFNFGNRDSGMVRLEHGFLRPTTLTKGGLVTGNRYEGHVIIVQSRSEAKPDPMRQSGRPDTVRSRVGHKSTSFLSSPTKGLSRVFWG